jgi:ABC-type Zn2+ transport system substrate-binding protein/surface adhesin
MADNKNGASKGLFEGIEQTGQQIKKLSIQKSQENEELSIKRGYTLRPSTIRKLQEMKVFLYTDPNITYNEIVDEAICLLYDTKKKNS